MNPIQDFDRLEAMGLWRENGARQRREVVVSFGKSTLVLTDINNNPLTHWSLASINHLGQSDAGTIFSVDADGNETLEIEDPTMIAAISKIRSSIDAARPRPGRLRFMFRIGAIALFTLLVIFWLPSKMKSYAARVVPEAKAQEIGDQVLAGIERITGQRCTSDDGTNGLDAMKSRLFPDARFDIHILQLGTKISSRLPDGDILLNGQALRGMDSPEIAAGYALAEFAREQREPIMQRLFRGLSVRETARFLSSGDIKQTRIDALAKQLLFETNAAVDDDHLRVLFFEAQTPHRPYANHANQATLAVLPNAQLDNVDPILTDAEWLSIVEICNG